MSFEIDISCSADTNGIDRDRFRAAILHALSVEQVAVAVLSVSVVDNDTIHRLNLEHLQHDFPTDVISFPLDWQSADCRTPSRAAAGRSAGAHIEGEIVVSLEYAREMAPRCNWEVQDELTLYAVHGMLHICGYDDLSPCEKAIMRSREQVIMEGLGLAPQYPDDADFDDDPRGPSLRITTPGDTHGEGRR